MGVIGDLGVVKLITFVFFHHQCDRCQSLDKALEVRARGGAYYDVCVARVPALTIQLHASSRSSLRSSSQVLSVELPMFYREC